MIQFIKLPKYFWLIFLLVNLIARGPDLYVYLNTPTGVNFAGHASWLDGIDLPVYVSALRQGLAGNLLYLNQYDFQSQARLPVYLFYTLSGFIFQWLPISPWLLFHLLGIFTSFILLLICYWAVNIFNPRFTKLSFILITLGSGLGWVFFYLFHLQLPDFTIPHVTLYSAWRTPHDGLSLATFLLTICAYYRFVSTPHKRFLLLSCLGFFITSLIHGFMIIPMIAIMATYQLFLIIQHKFSYFQLQPFVLFTIISILVYFFIALPVNHSPSTQGLILAPHPSPPIGYFLLSFALLIPFVFLSIRRKASNFLIIWFFVQATIIYLPFDYQRLMIRGLWIPFALLAIPSLAHLPRRFYFALIAISIIGMIAIPVQIIRHPSPLSFYSDRFDSYLQFLQTQTPTVVLSAVQASNLTPAYTDHHVVVGHPYLSPNSGREIDNLYPFYTGKFNSTQAIQYLSSHQITLVYCGTEEDAIANHQLPNYQFLQPIWQSGSAILYLVNTNGQDQ